jgi:hypothetical protein
MRYMMYVTRRMMAVPRDRMSRPCKSASSAGMLGAVPFLFLKRAATADEVEPSVLEKWSAL